MIFKVSDENGIMEKFIKKFSEINLTDIAEVGGKNSSLGEMFTQLSSKGINVPDGFATTATAFKYFLEQNQLSEILQQLMEQLDKEEFTNLKEIGDKARKIILVATMPENLTEVLINAYKELSGKKNIEVAVRSSATAEDLPQASFAGQHESYLNIKGAEALLIAVQKCFASLYTDRAIKYREDNKFEHQKVLLSVGVQKMVRSDKACAGVGFTLEPESGFRTPDEFLIFKPSWKIKKRSFKKEWVIKLKQWFMPEEKALHLL